MMPERARPGAGARAGGVGAEPRGMQAMASERRIRVPWAVAGRDLALGAGTLALWALDGHLRAHDGAVATAVAIAAGVATALCGYLLHEWGHLAGAWLAGAVVHPAQKAGSVFLFRFDSDLNGRREFLRMSWGGFVASGVVVAALLWLLPLGTLAGKVALGLVGLGVVATLVLELPPAWRVARGAPLPTGAAFVSSRE